MYLSKFTTHAIQTPQTLNFLHLLKYAMPIDIQDLQSCARLLNRFNTPSSIQQGKQLHLLFLKKGVISSTLSIANRLLQMYIRCGQINDAQNLFDEMPHRNSFTWNTLLEGYAKTGTKNEILRTFRQNPCKDLFSWNVVLSGLVKNGELSVAMSLFDEMPDKDGIAWNTMIHGFVKNREPSMSLRLFKEMFGGLSLDPFILATIVGACADLGSVELGKQVHCRMVVGCVEFDSILSSSVVNMYGKCGDLDSACRFLNVTGGMDEFSLSSLISGYASCGRMSEARKIFEELEFEPCVVLWNSMISGYVATGEILAALSLYHSMHERGVCGDPSTFSSVLSAYSSVGIVEQCMQMHTHVHKLGVVDDLIVSSALVDAYAKCGSYIEACHLFSELKTHDTVLLNSMISIYCNCGRIEEAEYIFNTMKLKSLISWNSMIVGLSQNGCTIEALDLFSKMNKMNLQMDATSLASIISTCASIPSIELGEQVFARAILIGVDLDQVIATSLIDFYCKCGFVDAGRKFFDQMTKFDEVSWNSMLMGYATNGYGIEALNLFHEMRREDVLPTAVTFTAVLSACDHCRFLEEGKKLFSLMKQEYNIDPGIEHYSCMVDMLARTGCVREAMNLINEMPCKPDANMWSAILRGCIINGDKSLSKNVVEKIIELDPQNGSAFVQLSGLLASEGNWEESAVVRQLMKDRRVQKIPGRSWCSASK